MTTSTDPDQPTAIDLFAGCGGLTLGLKQSGFRVIGAVDCEALAVETYESNHPEVRVWPDDIRLLKPSVMMQELKLEAGDLDLLAGCPPCQGFSRMRTLNGSLTVKDERKDFVFIFMEFIRSFEPKAVMMENVPGLAEDERMDRVLSELKELGYHVPDDEEDRGYVVKVLNAADYGVPQRRRRMILMTCKTGRVSFAPPFKKEDRVSAGTALARVREKHGGAGDGKDLAHDHGERRSDKVMGMIKDIPPNGGSRSDLGSERQLACHKEFGGFLNVYGRIDPSGPSVTITSGFTNPSKGRFLHPTENRALTVREGAALQGFPVDYQLSMRRGKGPASLMIGNAFPPPLIKPHAANLLKHLRGFSEAIDTQPVEENAGTLR